MIMISKLKDFRIYDFKVKPQAVSCRNPFAFDLKLNYTSDMYA